MPKYQNTKSRKNKGTIKPSEIHTNEELRYRDDALKVSHMIYNGFVQYMGKFREITGRAQARFEAQDWEGMQGDSKERLKLYKSSYRDVAKRIKPLLGDHSTNKKVWVMMKRIYTDLVRDRVDYEIAETYYNSACRVIFNNIPVDNDYMYIFSDQGETVFRSERPIFRVYRSMEGMQEIVEQILDDCRFAVPFEDKDRDIQYICTAIEEDVLSKYQPDIWTRVEILKAMFYRNKGAYLVGRIRIEGAIVPFLMPILHGKNGLYADTLLFDPLELSIVFSFTRSYFMVDVNIPSEMIAFIKSLMPYKSKHEIYNAIGFNKHGKTELYRSFLKHLARTKDKYEIAPGVKGMVMSVFHLPSYNIVFKLIKDKFDPPKTMTAEQVRAKYKLVSEHDRVGRMADTHEFVNLTFDKDRFSGELLEELLEVAPSKVIVTENQVVINHLYTERKMIPLNLYLEVCTEVEAEEAVDEYGNAIKQLAAANIFPGDMLLKNFGVTPHGRVVFYDYDEISFLTECNFRRIPKPRRYEDEMSGEPYYSVGPNDIFPEEFTKFLIGNAEIRNMFLRLHGDIFDAAFWTKTQNRIVKGEVLNVFPYRRRLRFVNRYGPDEDKDSLEDY